MARDAATRIERGGVEHDARAVAGDGDDVLGAQGRGADGDGCRCVIREEWSCLDSTPAARRARAAVRGILCL